MRGWGWGGGRTGDWRQAVFFSCACVCDERMLRGPTLNPFLSFSPTAATMPAVAAPNNKKRGQPAVPTAGPAPPPQLAAATAAAAAPARYRRRRLPPLLAPPRECCIHCESSDFAEGPAFVARTMVMCSACQVRVAARNEGLRGGWDDRGKRRLAERARARLRSSFSPLHSHLPLSLALSIGHGHPRRVPGQGRWIPADGGHGGLRGAVVLLRGE